MSNAIHVDPGFHLKRIQESLYAFTHGREVEAATTAMMAGVNAGLSGIIHCPFDKPEHEPLRAQWAWGRMIASTANENAIQGELRV